MRARWSVRSFVTAGAAAVLAAGLVGLGGVGSASGANRPPPPPGTGPLTLVFGGQLTGASGFETPTQPYPPLETVDSFTVPANARLVIQSVYSWVEEYSGTLDEVTTAPRAAMETGVQSSYDIGRQYPGCERDYGIPLGSPVSWTQVDPQGFLAPDHRQWFGNLPGPIYVEGGRILSGWAFAPGGDARVVVRIIVHGYLEGASNPAPLPACQAPPIPPTPAG